MTPCGRGVRRAASLAALIGVSLFATHGFAGEGAVRILKTVDGLDWSLPSWVRMTPNAGYFARGPWIANRRRLPRFQDGAFHFAQYVALSWRELNPAEDTYRWDLVEEKIRSVTTGPHDGFVFWIRAYSRYHYARWKWARSEQERQRILKTTCMVPQWVIEKGNVRFLSNGAVAAWEPGCGYQKYFGRFLRALGERYRNHPKLIGVDMRGLDYRYGEWCWPGGPTALKEAEEKTGLTPDTLRAWGLQFARDYVDAFRGQERKLVWPCCEQTFISRRGTKYDYGPASRAIWKFALSKGCGVRDGMPTAWFRYITPGWGCTVTPEGYLVFDETYLPYRNHALMYSENDGYRGWDTRRFGPVAMNGVRFFITSLRVLQLRRSWEWIPWPIMDQITKQLAPYGGDAFVTWVEYELGKRAETSPDAWCWLREGYRAKWAGYKPIKNFERWLLQRDVAPDGQTAPAEKIDISMLESNYPSGKGYEFHARRTDVARGSRYMYFRVERQFLSGGPHHVQIKVSYLDGPTMNWQLEYTGPAGRTKTPLVKTADTGRWKTVTFDVPNMTLSGAFAKGMDFRLAVTGDRDVTVKLVRLIRPNPPKRQGSAVRP